MQSRTGAGTEVLVGGSPRRPLPLPLAVAAAVTVVVAVAMDILADEHPTHTLVVGLAAVVVAAVRVRLAGRFDGVLSSISGALVAQPALHATATLSGAHPETGADGLLSAVASHGSTSMVQIVVPTLVVLAVAFCSQIVELVLTFARRRPQRRLSVQPIDTLGACYAPVARTSRLGSMLRWCGWTLQTARRGPPSPVHPFSLA